jgi:hypothetical protein
LSDLNDDLAPNGLDDGFHCAQLLGPMGECGQRARPERVQVGAQLREPVGIDLVEPAGAGDTAGRVTGSSPASWPTASGPCDSRSKIA